MEDSKKVKLSNGGSLTAFLCRVIDEGVKSALSQKALTEKEKQDALSGGTGNSGGDVDDLFGGDSSPSSGDGDQEAGDGGNTSKTMDDETEKLKSGDVEVKDIVEKLNSIRSGKSFKDEKVSGAMEQYINSLSKPEKVALYAFMKGIAGIVTGEVQGQQAEEPSDNPSDVKMQKGPAAPKVKHITPNVIKGANKAGDQKPNNGQQKAGAEDTSSPAPITPRKR